MTPTHVLQWRACHQSNTNNASWVVQVNNQKHCDCWFMDFSEMYWKRAHNTIRFRSHHSPQCLELLLGRVACVCSIENLKRFFCLSQQTFKSCFVNNTDQLLCYSTCTDRTYMFRSSRVREVQQKQTYRHRIAAMFVNAVRLEGFIETPGNPAQRCTAKCPPGRGHPIARVHTSEWIPGSPPAGAPPESDRRNRLVIFYRNPNEQSAQACSQDAVKAIHPTGVNVTRCALKSRVLNSTPCWPRDHPSASIARCNASKREDARWKNVTWYKQLSHVPYSTHILSHPTSVKF